MHLASAIIALGLGVMLTTALFTDAREEIDPADISALAAFAVLSALAHHQMRRKMVMVEDEEDAADESKQHEVFDELSFDFSCPYCRRPIQLRARSCPHCASPLSEKSFRSLKKGTPTKTEPPAPPPSDYA